MTTTASATGVLWRITVSPQRPQLDAHGHAVLRDIHDLGFTHVVAVSSSRLYLIEGDLDSDRIQRIASELLTDPVTEAFRCSKGGDDPRLPGDSFDAAIEIHLKGGVMDPVAASALAAIHDMFGMPVNRAQRASEHSTRSATEDRARSASEGFVSKRSRTTSPPPAPSSTAQVTNDLTLSTARLYQLTGIRNADEATAIAKRLLSNDCMEDVYLTLPMHHDLRPDHLPVAPTREFSLRHIAIRSLHDTALAKLSREGHLFLSLEEMRAIQNHYKELDRDPTDLELETFAQTWSEHCVHKTLKSAVRYTGEPMPNPDTNAQKAAQAPNLKSSDLGFEIHYDNLLRDTIARATRDLIAAGKVDWCLSVFEDNAGIIVFDDQYGLAFKAETHNHPSAIEPYGGAATGIGGCIRDIMGCGLGAKPIANTDIFCVASPDFPAAALPKGVLHPRRVLKGVVSGVRDYGNRMGIPTVNGAIVFDDRYLGNPLVFAGSIGLIPRNRIKKAPQPGDLVVVIGGRTGRDGIHGATFSSAELTDTHADEFSHAVQIGNAITQKQVLDAQLTARDHASGCLYTAVTDCGAGGLSSAIGEMAAKLGATVDLEKVPLKYSGLRYDEIWISEAQERMVFSVPPANWPTFKKICDGENVEATAIGEFRGDGKLLLRYNETKVGEINCHFLHEGIPKTTKTAFWPGKEYLDAISSRLNQQVDETMDQIDLTLSDTDRANRDERNRGGEASQSEINSQFAIDDPQFFMTPLNREVLLSALCDRNVASKEWLIRQYDHEVQGGSVIKPLVGPGQGPSDAAVIRPVLGSNKGIVIANGICPIGVGPAYRQSNYDPYWMAVAAIDEAIRNIVCVGGDPRRTAILDNFCWGNCEDHENMGALVRACQACYDAAMAYGTPFISGKDSLNNEFAIDPADAERLAGRIPLHNNRIRIPGTLLISAISVIDDVHKCITMDAKVRPGEASLFYYVGLKAQEWQEVSLADAAKLHTSVANLIASGQVLAAHDVSEHGIVSTLAEMAIAGQCGLTCWTKNDEVALTSPLTSGYVLQIATQGAAQTLEKELGKAGMVVRVAEPNQGQHMTACGVVLFDLAELAAAWRKPLNW